MTVHGQGSPDRLDPGGKAAVAPVATPQSPGTSASGPPVVPGSSTAEPLSALHTEQPAIPDHELLHCIGRGSYGAVWLARNVLGQYRAVKVIRRVHFDSDHAYEREFEGLKRYEPVSRGAPSQVAVLHVGRQDEAGFYYYVMELADNAEAKRSEGVAENCSAAAQHSITPALQHPISSYAPRTLKSDLAQRKRLPLDKCIEIGLALTTALEHLHGHGLIHRDIKPSNVIFIGGVPKLADIGLVAAMDATMSFVGTAGYMPPEGPGKPTGDIYSLGKVLYEISVGRNTSEFPELPTAWESFAEQKQQLEFNAVVLKACATDPGQRYRTAREMHADLVRVQAGQSVRRKQRLARTMKLGKQAAPIVTLAVALLAAAVALWPRATAPINAVPASAQPLFVLPLRSPPGDTVSAELAGRVSDALIDSLGILLGPGRVGPRKSGWLARSEDEARRLAFVEHNAWEALEGKVTVVSNRMEVTLASYITPTNSPVWTQVFGGTTNEVMTLEWTVIDGLARRLSVDIPERVRSDVSQILVNNLAALDWCRKGAAYASAYSDGRLTSAKDAYYRAVALDPNYCDAHAGVIFVNRAWFWNRSCKESWPDVLDRSRTILKIDDTHYMARYWLACSKCDYEWDWEAAKRECEVFFQEPPPHHTSLAIFYRMIGRMEKARFHQAKVDAQSPQGLAELFFSFAAKYVEALYDEMAQGRRGKGEDGRFDKVIAGGRHIQKLYPENHLGCQLEAMGHLGKHDYPAVIEAARRGEKLYENQDLHALAGYAYARLGDKEQANKTLGELERLPYPQPYCIARIHAALGHRDLALMWLERACEDRSEFLIKPDLGYGALRLDEAWDDLRSEPRFEEVLRRTGLNQWPR